MCQEPEKQVALHFDESEGETHPTYTQGNYEDSDGSPLHLQINGDTYDPFGNENTNSILL
jgi:hypothetical protein